MLPADFRSRNSSTRGQTILLFTLSLPVVLGLLGLVVDAGWMFWRREACLTAAQAAASASVMTASKSTTSYPANCNTSTTLWCSATPVLCDASPANPPSNNFQTACLYAKANGYSNANRNQKVMVAANNGSTADAPNVSPSYYVTVTVTEKIPLTFLAAMGAGYFGVASASATGGIFSQASGGCLYVLDPTGKDALNASNNAHIMPSCGVQIASNNSEAAIATGSAQVTTSGNPQPPIQVVGTAAKNNNGSYSPNPTSTASVSDPLSSLDVPWTNCTGTGCPTTNCQYTGCSTAAGVCNHTNFTVSSNSWSPPYVHLTPGVYCGTGGSAAITINNGNSAIFDSGMYVINGGGVSIQSGSGNSGSNVIFYLTGTNSTYGGVNFANGTTVNFSAPSTGDLADVLIYGDRTLTAPTGSNATSQFQGGASSTIDGIIYLPTTTVNFANGTTTANRTSLVVKDAIFAGGTYVFTTDPAGTLRGSGTVSPFVIGLH